MAKGSAIGWVAAGLAAWWLLRDAGAEQEPPGFEPYRVDPLAALRRDPKGQGADTRPAYVVRAESQGTATGAALADRTALGGNQPIVARLYQTLGLELPPERAGRVVYEDLRAALVRVQRPDPWGLVDPFAGTLVPRSWGLELVAAGRGGQAGANYRERAAWAPPIGAYGNLSRAQLVSAYADTWGAGPDERSEQLWWPLSGDPGFGSTAYPWIERAASSSAVAGYSGNASEVGFYARVWVGMNLTVPYCLAGARSRLVRGESAPLEAAANFSWLRDRSDALVYVSQGGFAAYDRRTGRRTDLRPYLFDEATGRRYDLGPGSGPREAIPRGPGIPESLRRRAERNGLDASIYMQRGFPEDVRAGGVRLTLGGEAVAVGLELRHITYQRAARALRWVLSSPGLRRANGPGNLITYQRTQAERDRNPERDSGRGRLLVGVTR